MTGPMRKRTPALRAEIAAQVATWPISEALHYRLRFDEVVKKCGVERSTLLAVAKGKTVLPHIESALRNLITEVQMNYTGFSPEMRARLNDRRYAELGPEPEPQPEPSDVADAGLDLSAEDGPLTKKLKAALRKRDKWGARADALAIKIAVRRHAA